uniref:Uncharacterized protein n=1 Tax=Anguilla anguilla TaxID=7936 RepID=A0A0E9SIE6_ANGAN
MLQICEGSGFYSVQLSS